MPAEEFDRRRGDCVDLTVLQLRHEVELNADLQPTMAAHRPQPLARQRDLELGPDGSSKLARERVEIVADNDQTSGHVSLDREHERTADDPPAKDPDAASSPQSGARPLGLTAVPRAEHDRSGHWLPAQIAVRRQRGGGRDHKNRRGQDRHR